MRILARRCPSKTLVPNKNTSIGSWMKTRTSCARCLHLLRSRTTGPGTPFGCTTRADTVSRWSPLALTPKRDERSLRGRLLGRTPGNFDTVQVLMVHGLARTPLSLVWLASALRRGGYRPAHFGYLAFAESYGRILERLRSRLSLLAAGGRYAIVAHSLGGLLVRAALADRVVPPPEYFVMLGTPNESGTRS